MNKLNRLALRFRGMPLRLMLLPWVMWWMPGCASPDYALYLNAEAARDAARYQLAAEQAKAHAVSQAAKYAAIQSCLSDPDCDPVAKALLAASLQRSENLQQQQFQTDKPLAAPTPIGETFLRAASIVVPALAQVGIAVVQSNNARRTAEVQAINSRGIAESNNAKDVGIAKLIQAPAANNTLYGDGAINGSATISSRNATVAGNGTIGNDGTYSDSNNRPVTTTETNTDSHQTSTSTDNHSTATDNHSTVTPAPVVITPVITSTPVTSTLTTTTGSTGFTPWVTP
ncbi:MAG: hypothetical protein WBP33_00450 [Saprospiraceae bacterium]